MAVQGVGGLYAAGEQRAAGRSTQAYYDALAASAKQESEIALRTGEQRATLAEDQGAIDSRIVARNADKLAGSQAVAMAANGLGSGSVTAEDITRDTFDKKTLDEMAVRYNADSRAWEAKTEASYKSWDALNRSKGYTTAGVNSRAAGNAAATTTLFSTASQLLGTGLSYSLRGADLDPTNTNPAKIK